MRKYIKTIIFVISITLSTVTYSQPLPNGDPGSNGDTPVGGQASADGGLPILLLAGVAYGIVNFRKKNTTLLEMKE